MNGQVGAEFERRHASLALGYSTICFIQIITATAPRAQTSANIASVWHEVNSPYRCVVLKSRCGKVQQASSDDYGSQHIKRDKNIVARKAAGPPPVRLWRRQQNGRRSWTTSSERRSPFHSSWVDNTAGETARPTTAVVWCQSLFWLINVRCCSGRRWLLAIMSL